MKVCWRCPLKMGHSETDSQFEACPALVADPLLSDAWGEIQRLQHFGTGGLGGVEKIEIERKAVELYCTCSQNYSSKLKRADFAHGIMTFTLMFRFSVYTRDKLKWIYLLLIAWGPNHLKILMLTAASQQWVYLNRISIIFIQHKNILCTYE